MTKSNPLQAGWAIYLYSNDQTTQRRHLATIQQTLLAASDLPLLYEFVDRETQRADYQRLITAARLGQFSHLAVANLEALGRDAQQVTQMISEVQQLGVSVRIANLPHLKLDYNDDQPLIAAYFALLQHEEKRFARLVRQGLAAKRAANQKGDNLDG